MTDCCADGVWIIDAGGNVEQAIEFRDEVSEELQPMLPKARAVFIDPETGATVLAIDDAHFTINTPSDGLGSISLSSAETASLALDQRRRLDCVIEFYDDGVSPTYRERIPAAEVIVNPDVFA